MSISRRQFMGRSAAALAGASLGPSLFGRPLVRQAVAQTLGDRYLVVVFLDGGNDGLNSVIPLDDTAGFRSAYETFRQIGSGGLQISLDSTVVPDTPLIDPATGTRFGLHPALAPFGRLYDAGKLAIVQGVGYPDYSLSHNESSKIWKTGNPARRPALGDTGWVGRHLAGDYGPDTIPAVASASSIPGEMNQGRTNVLAIDNLAGFGLALDDYEFDLDEVVRWGENYLSIVDEQAASPQPTAGYLGRVARAYVEASRDYRFLWSLYDEARYPFSARYSDLNSRFAIRLRDIAMVMHGVATGVPGVDPRLFQCARGGFDTHSNQGSVGDGSLHQQLLEDVATPMEVFMEDLEIMGLADKTTIVVWTEFGRRVPQNANGTDHGSQGPMFVIGGSVNGGIYGNHPNIVGSALDGSGNTPYSQGAGTFRSTDFRDVYGTILKHWLNMSESAILTDVFPPDIGDAESYWTTHDFDLAFL